MKFMRGTLLAVGILSLGACSAFKSHTEVEALNEAETVGSPFTQKLAAEYREYSNNEQNIMFDYPDALHFARKGLAAASGEVVMPEPVGDWNLSAEHIDDLTEARSRLVVAFDLGAREIAPNEAAIAQARFDCWIERQEEDWYKDASKGCRTQFIETIKSLEGYLQTKPEPVAAPAPALMPAPIKPVADIMAPVSNTAVIEDAPEEPMAIEDAMYLVFFDFDSSKITSGAKNVLSAVADEINSRDNISKIVITGHTDTSGPSEYNDRLSLRRAKSAANALIKVGVPADMIKVSSKGEKELLVNTSDNMKEPANRRVNISFE